VHNGFKQAFRPGRSFLACDLAEAEAPAHRLARFRRAPTPAGCRHHSRGARRSHDRLRAGERALAHTSRERLERDAAPEAFDSCPALIRVVQGALAAARGVSPQGFAALALAAAG
jgi:hypothetical protein